jgi:hypothetical protein
MRIERNHFEIRQVIQQNHPGGLWSDTVYCLQCLDRDVVEIELDDLPKSTFHPRVLAGADHLQVGHQRPRFCRTPDRVKRGQCVGVFGVQRTEKQIELVPGLRGLFVGH